MAPVVDAEKKLGRDLWVSGDIGVPAHAGTCCAL